jgi:tripartite-type tricarboxylate transporter receptor subunit TctC
VALVGVTPMLVVVPKNSPYNTLQELIAAAAKASGKLTFCSGGQGTVQYMGAELFNQGVGIKMLHVPYRAGGLALQAILAGEVDMGFFNLPALSSHIKGGALKPLAITSAKRNPLFPNVPTISEAGVKNYEVYEWNGMFVPSTTPAEIVTRLNTAVREVLAMPEVKARFDALGSEIVGSQPDEFRSASRRSPRGGPRPSRPQASRRSRRVGAASAPAPPHGLTARRLKMLKQNRLLALAEKALTAILLVASGACFAQAGYPPSP